MAKKKQRAKSGKANAQKAKSTPQPINENIESPPTLSKCLTVQAVAA